MDDVLYKGKMAENWYDVYCADEDGMAEDIDRILKENGCKSVIDVGCGTGKNSVRLAGMGYRVFGVDVSPDMVAKASSKGSTAEFTVADMREISSNERFDAAICIDSAFCYMLSNDDCIKALSAMSSVLKKGGLLVIHTMNMWPEMADGSFQEKWTRVERHGDKELVVEGDMKIDPVDNFMDETSTYRGRISGVEKIVSKDSSPVRLRIFTPSQMDLLFRLSGFESVGFYGDMRMGTLSANNCDWLVSVARKI